MSEYAVMPLNDYVNICDAVRDKTNTTDSVKSTEMADKITQVHNAGQISALETSEHIKGNASGNVITVNDISPVEHTITVKISSDTVEDFSGVSVRVCGKNLFPYPYDVTTNTANGITFTDNGDGSITVDGTATDTAYFRIGNLYDMPATQYYLSGCDDRTVEMHIEAYSEDNEWVAGTYNTNPLDLTDKTFYRLYTILKVKSGTTVDNVTVRPQLEIGTAPTEFECGKEFQTATANADGTVEGLTSLHPNITVFTDNPDVNIELEYYKGIDSVYEEVYEAGQKSMVDESKIIEKTVTGLNFITVDDVSEIPHEIKVQLYSDTVTDFSNVTVTKCGANLLPVNDKEFTQLTKINFDVPLPKDTYTISGIITSDQAVDYHWVRFMNAEGVEIGAAYFADSTNEQYFSCPLRGECAYIYIYSSTNGASSIGVNGEISSLQVVRGTVVPPYESYNSQIVTANSDGTIEGLTLLSPNMTIMTDTDGVNISLTYNKSYGAQTEYDRFWDIYQENGKKTNYIRAFGGISWNKETFRPKYDIKPTDLYGIFWGATNLNFDLTEHLDNLGITFDMSKTTEAVYVFSGSGFTRLPKLVVINIGTINQLCMSCTQLKTIDEIVGSEKNIWTTSAFSGCTALRNLKFSGVIATSFNIHYSPLTAESIKSIMNALSDTVSGSTVTFSLTAVNNAFETSEGAADGSTSEEWTTLISTKSNWTISLV